MTFNIRNYISGTVTIKVSGAMPEKFINLCMVEKKSLLSITKKDNDFLISMYLYDFFSIRPLVRKSKSRVQVVSYSGLPFLARKMRRRKMLIVGGMAFVILLNVLMSYIWFIDIVGMHSIPMSHIREVVYQNGLKPGTLRDAVSAKKIENQLLLSIPEIAWVSINFTGTHAVVEVVEKTISKQQDKTPAHIIAAKDGVVTEVIVLAGESAIKKGATVKKGDVLIKGFVYEGKVIDPAAETRVPQLIRSNGIVKARVWYEGYGETELTKFVYERSGKQEMSVTFKIGQYEIPLKRAAIDSQQAVEVEVFNKKLSWWRNSDIAVESIVSTYYEMNANPVSISIEEAREEGKAKALAEVQSLIPETAQIVSRTIEVLQTSEPNLVRVKVNVETAEDIGQFMNIQ